MQTEEQARHLLQYPLDYPGLVQRRYAREKIRLWRAPSFDPQAAWVVISDDDGWFVRRVVHARRTAGGEIFHDTFGAEVPLSERVATALIRSLYALSFDPLVERKTNLIALDGARYGVEIRDDASYCYCSGFSWGPTAPPEWRALRDWYAGAIKALEPVLPPSSVPLQVHHPWVE